jgi:hypothetical protein
MRRAHVVVGVLALALSALMTTVASAAPEHWDVEITPVFFLDGTGDSSAPRPPGTVAAYCPGYGGVPVPPDCPGSPTTTRNVRLNYGVSYRFSPKLNIAYTHEDLDFTLGRVTSIAPLSVLTGDVDDRTDRIAVNYAYGRGIALNAHWFSHERSGIAASASPLLQAATGSNCFFNSEQCPGARSNPASINSNAYGVGAAYSFGPHARFQPPMFKIAVDADYYPRPPSQSAGACIAGGGPGSNAPVCGAEGVPGYVGSQTAFPYSLTAFPLATTRIKPGLVPFVAYERVEALFHAENTPEAYNAVAWGFVKSLGHGFTLNYTNFKLNGCYCSNTVPPPDSVRSDVSILKLTYRFGF